MIFGLQLFGVKTFGIQMFGEMTFGIQMLERMIFGIQIFRSTDLREIHYVPVKQ